MKCILLQKQIFGFINYLRHSKLIKKTLVVVLIYNLQFIIYNLFAAFQDYGWSVRAEGMGGVFVAKSDDPSGISYNPAGISFVAQRDIVLMYAKPYLGLEGVDFGLMSFSGVIPAEKFSFGVSYNRYNISELYVESAGILSFASGLKKYNINLPEITIGVNIKYLSKKYFYDEEVKILEPGLKDSKSVISFDIGSIYKPVEKLSLGVSIKDLNSPNISVFEDGQDIIPRTIKFGLSYNFGDIKNFEDLSVGSDISYREQEWGESGDKIDVSIGLETYFSFHTYVLRVGGNKTGVSFGAGYLKQLGNNFTIQINYSLGFSTIYTEGYGTHKISLDLKF